MWWVSENIKQSIYLPIKVTNKNVFSNKDWLTVEEKKNNFREPIFDLNEIYDSNNSNNKSNVGE